MSAYVYLQIMIRLPETHPDAHRKFMEGYHDVVRRSDRFWAGLSPDPIIEQCRARINETMQTFSGVSYETSDQHMDVSAAKQARDVSDTVDLIDYLNERDPFVQNDSLYNVANGMTAQEIVKNQLRSSYSGKLIKQSR